MKKTYTKPAAEKMDFDFSSNVFASGEQGHKYRLYTDSYYGCREKATEIWVDEPVTP